MVTASRTKIADLLIKSLSATEKDAKKIEALTTFTKSYYKESTAYELRHHENANLITQAKASFETFKKNAPKTPIVHVYNPDYSYHSVVEIHAPDMPFLVDSLWLNLTELGYNSHHTFHPVFEVERNDKGSLKSFVAATENGTKNRETFIHVEFDREEDPEALAKLQKHLEKVFADIHCVVEDYQPIMRKLSTLCIHIENDNKAHSDNHSEEIDFIKWLYDNNFIFFGYRPYDVKKKKDGTYIKSCQKESLGLFRKYKSASAEKEVNIKDLRSNMTRFITGDERVVISKALSKSNIHRHANMDYIGIKEYNQKGEVVREHRFTGLFTSRAYNTYPNDIPMVRNKIKQVLTKEKEVGTQSHDYKGLINILETYPRDELFQISVDDLHRISTGILSLKERKQVRVFLRHNCDENLISAFVYVPKDQMSRNLRLQIEGVLGKKYNSSDIEHTLFVGEMPFARLFFTIRVENEQAHNVDDKEVESAVSEIAEHWDDKLTQALTRAVGEHKGIKLAKRYAPAFSNAYKANATAVEALADIETIEGMVSEKDDFHIGIYRSPQSGRVHLKLFNKGEKLALSSMMPILENMNLHVEDEYPTPVCLNGTTYWIHDFTVAQQENALKPITDEAVIERVTFAIKEIWADRLSNEPINALLTVGNLGVEALVALRTLIAFNGQARSRFSQGFVQKILVKYPTIASKLWKLFDARFNPNLSEKESEKLQAELTLEFEDIIQNVELLDEDLILRRLKGIILATVRTNAYARNSVTDTLALKIASALVPRMPKPHPRFEIFMYSNKIEGVHLRSGMVSRGGIRWSDRQADYRTEVLGLVKAQKTKNAVIVPDGSKGGFVIKGDMPEFKSREEFISYGETGYKEFIRNLLTVTDNLAGGKVVPPQNVKRYDDDDPYLVVAADKGTATFSDTANQIAVDHGFWLADAFASGGSQGYDHKKMGITAKGAWECVKHHFRRQGKDIQKEDFTVVGIGDMSGDVFGNGMLLSKHIRLVAAFNHMHIFIDPNPVASTSFKERSRLFKNPRLQWTDYNQDLISEGGGVFDRSAKSITLTPQIQEALGISDKTLSPNELISAILKAKVDLWWNGGIGTYIKATTEDHLKVGDRANDLVRVDAPEVRASVIGEGGNLGLTQLSRIELAQNGVIVNMDSIDNSAGVDCSDHEVNIKILLGQAIEKGLLTEEARNKLLAEMTDNVSELVLKDNYLQSEALTQAQLLGNIDEQQQLIRDLEHKGLFERAIEYLPEDEEIEDRKSKGKGLTRPELSVLLSYAKIDLYNALVVSDLSKEKSLGKRLTSYFPVALQEKYGDLMPEHRLRNEIIITEVTNEVVNRLGILFMNRMRHQTGQDEATITRAFLIAKELYNLDEAWTRIAALDHKVPTELQDTLYAQVRELAMAVTTWFLRNGSVPLSLDTELKAHKDTISQIFGHVKEHMTASMANRQTSLQKEWMAQGLADKDAIFFAQLMNMKPAQDISAIVQNTSATIAEVMTTHFMVDERLHLADLHRKVHQVPMLNNWHRVATSSIIDDLHNCQKIITTRIMETKNGHKLNQLSEVLELYLNHKEQMVHQFEHMVDDITEAPQVDHAMFNVALGQLKGILH